MDGLTVHPPYLSCGKHSCRYDANWSCCSPWLTELLRTERAEWYTDGIPCAYNACSSVSGRSCCRPCRKGTLSIIARIAPDVGSRRPARTGGQRKTSRKPYGYAGVAVASGADANNQREQAPGVGRLRAGL